MSETIVLVHGVLGFDRLPAPVGDYFVGVADHLRRLGHRVYVADVSPTRSIRDRADELDAYLQTIPLVGSRRCHLLAHSMGGLDARYLLHHSDAARIRVQTLVTIGTPHWGSPVADAVKNDIGFPLSLINTAWEAFHRNTASLEDLTTEACQEFNRQIPITPGIRHLFIGGDASRSPTYSIPFGALEYYVDLSRPNDGVVEKDSALYVGAADVERWPVLWPADHGELVGRESGPPRLTNLFFGDTRQADHLRRYEQVLASLIRRR